MLSLLNAIEQTDTSYKPGIMELFDEFSDMVYRVAYVRVHQPADTDDVFQEVFLRLVKYIGRLRNHEHAKAWLIRCTINCCNNHHRSAWQKKTVALEENTYESRQDLSYEHIELLDAVHALSPEHREAIHLYYYEGYSIKEIADLLKSNENTVKSRLRRARMELREIWGEEDEYCAAQ